MRRRFQGFTLPLEERDKVSRLLGSRAELSAFYNCVMDRSSFDSIAVAMAARHPGGLPMEGPTTGTLAARAGAGGKSTGHGGLSMTGSESWCTD